MTRRNPMRKPLALLLAAVLLFCGVPLAQAAETGSRTVPLDLTQPGQQYLDSNGNMQTFNPATDNVLLADNSENWSWDYASKTLTLEGAEIDTSASPGPAIILPDSAKVHLKNGSQVTGTTGIRGDNMTVTSQGYGRVVGTAPDGAGLESSTGTITIQSSDDGLVINGAGVAVRGAVLCLSGSGPVELAGGTAAWEIQHIIFDDSNEVLMGFLNGAVQCVDIPNTTPYTAICFVPHDTNGYDYLTDWLWHPAGWEDTPDASDRPYLMPKGLPKDNHIYPGQVNFQALPVTAPAKEGALRLTPASWILDPGPENPDPPTLFSGAPYAGSFHTSDFASVQGGNLVFDYRVEVYEGGGWMDVPDYTMSVLVELGVDQPPSSSSDDRDFFYIKAKAGEGGEITPQGNVQVYEHEDRTFRITPKEGYRIADVTVDGKSVGPVAEYTFQSVREDHTITASFREGSLPANPETGRSSAPPWVPVTLALGAAGASLLWSRARGRNEAED